MALSHILVFLLEHNYRTFETNSLSLRIDHFQNDDNCETWSRFSKGEFRGLIYDRLCLDEEMFAHLYSTTKFQRFHREEIFICLRARNACGLSHTVMDDMIFGGDDGIWGAGHNHVMEFLDEKFKYLIDINILSSWVHNLTQFSE